MSTQWCQLVEWSTQNCCPLGAELGLLETSLNGGGDAKAGDDTQRGRRELQPCISSAVIPVEDRASHWRTQEPSNRALQALRDDVEVLRIEERGLLRQGALDRQPIHRTIREVAVGEDNRLATSMSAGPATEGLGSAFPS